jgi:hypothetical protein
VCATVGAASASSSKVHAQAHQLIQANSVAAPTLAAPSGDPAAMSGSQW